MDFLKIADSDNVEIVNTLSKAEDTSIRIKVGIAKSPIHRVKCVENVRSAKSNEARYAALSAKSARKVYVKRIGEDTEKMVSLSKWLKEELGKDKVPTTVLRVLNPNHRNTSYHGWLIREVNNTYKQVTKKNLNKWSK